MPWDSWAASLAFIYTNIRISFLNNTYCFIPFSRRCCHSRFSLITMQINTIYIFEDSLSESYLHICCVQIQPHPHSRNLLMHLSFWCSIIILLSLMWSTELWDRHIHHFWLTAQRMNDRSIRSLSSCAWLYITWHIRISILIECKELKMESRISFSIRIRNYA